MKTQHSNPVGTVTCALLAATLAAAQGANPPAAKIIEAQRRMDSTGAGSFHRQGLLRELENTRQHLARKQKNCPVGKKESVSKS